MAYHNQLPISVQFHAEKGKIQQITLKLHSQKQLKWELISATTDAALESAVDHWMESYLSKVQPKIQLPLSMENLPTYTAEVLNKLITIPFGTKVSYQELAILTGKPLAARAVGNACGRNPFPLIIPCHRVVRNDGGLGGFSGGLEIKQHLLDFEDEF